MDAAQADNYLPFKGPGTNMNLGLQDLEQNATSLSFTQSMIRCLDTTHRVAESQALRVFDLQ